MFSEAFLGNGATSVLGACAGGLDGMPLSDVIAAWRSVGEKVRGVLLYAATRVMLLTNVMLLYQLDAPYECDAPVSAAAPGAAATCGRILSLVCHGRRGGRAAAFAH